MIPTPTCYSNFDPDFTYTSRNVEVKGEKTAKQYLEFAIADFELDETNKGRINSFSNAKRALHLQVETLASLFGFDAIKTKGSRYASFP